MYVKGLLHRGPTVSQEEVDAFSPHAVEVGKIRSVAHGDHQNVSRIDRPSIHERGAVLVAKEKRRGKLAG
jgi:hypothetical protein